MNLNRVLEPEVMDDPQEAIDYDSMDHAEVNARFVTDLLAFHPVSESTSDEDVDPVDVLDLGTGTALIPIELCRQFASCRVMAVDMATSMLDRARYNVEAAGLIEQIALRHLDAKELPIEDGQFDFVLSNSIVHHIPDPRTVLTEAIRVAKTGGLLFFRDLLRPTDDQAVRHLVETYAGGENERQQKLFDDSLRAALTLEEVRQLIRDLGSDPMEVQATSDRHWTWATRKS